MRRYAIPRAVPEALLEGLGWDTEGRRYETLEDLQGYAARVAATVGVMMTLLMRVRAPSALARACDLGVAMQLTNIARDVGEDARAGRIYLPLQWLDEAGVDVEDFLQDPRPSPELASVVARLLAEADRLYQRSRAGVAELPGACRPAILAASTIYAEIGREVEKHSHDSITRRARVTGRRKLALLAQAAASAARLASAPPAPPIPATAFLVDAVTHSRMAVIPDSTRHRWRPAVIPAGARYFRTVGAVRTIRRLKWIRNIIGVIEIVFAFGVVLLIGFQQLYSLNKAKKKRLERESAKDPRPNDGA